jgi:hypothetical protein
MYRLRAYCIHTTANRKPRADCPFHSIVDLLSSFFFFFFALYHSLLEAVFGSGETILQPDNSWSSTPEINNKKSKKDRGKRQSPLMSYGPSFEHLSAHFWLPGPCWPVLNLTATSVSPHRQSNNRHNLHGLAFD